MNFKGISDRKVMAEWLTRPRGKTPWIVSLIFIAGLLSTSARPADGDDPWGIPHPMPAGPHKGKPILMHKKRPIKILSAEEAAPYHPAQGDLVFANFNSEKKFWIAKLPADAVETVYFQKEHYSKIMPIQHALLRFKLKPGKEITLYPQSGTEMPTRNKIS